MQAITLSKDELSELCGIMSVGNTALKQCADMMKLKHNVFRGKLFNGELDTSSLSSEQLQQLNEAKPLIFAVRNKCEEKVRAGFKRMVHKQAYIAAKNNCDPYNAKPEFIQEGEFAVLNATYGYTDIKIKLSTFIWRCVRRRIVAAINRMNPFCPLTNEALDLVRRVQEVKTENPFMSEEEVVEVLGLSSGERDVFFSSITKVVNENTENRTSTDNLDYDDYTSHRRGVDRDFKEVFFIRKDARQALKDANLDDFELACVFGDTFPYHGWKEDIASKHINERTGKRYTRQNIQYVLERTKEKIRQAYLNPPQVHLENPLVDKFFSEWGAERAVEDDQASHK